MVIGGGAAGFFGAITAKHANPRCSVEILELSSQLLMKVLLSGGGRCNVTHHCFDPKELAQHYPRGHKELIGLFHRFQPKDTVAWFEARGVQLKTEADGRIFPITDDANTIANCLKKEAADLGIPIHTRCKIESIEKEGSEYILKGEQFEKRAEKILLATGSHPSGHRFAEKLGHKIEKLVPSLFTFNVPEFPLSSLSGISVPHALLTLEGSKLKQQGALLITHWGFSGPAALKLSAWGARLLHEKNYEVTLQLAWLGNPSPDALLEILEGIKNNQSAQQLSSTPLEGIPKNLWLALLTRAGLPQDLRWRDASKKALRQLATVLAADRYPVKGKTTHKAEFVTCGGILLKEVDLKTLESRISPGLHFAGEILDIDGETGGFNFQNAWTTGYLSGLAAAFIHTST